METKGKEFWVGLFVLVGIVVICGMILRFGNFRERLHDMYRFDVRFTNAGQIARGAPVITAGVGVGKVDSITLDKEGGVRLTLAIWKGIKIGKDSQFTIKQAGLLGDLHVVVTPVSDKAPPIEEGGLVEGTNPTDIQDTLTQAAQIVLTMKIAADNIESATRKLDKQVMNEDSLTNLRNAISNASVVASNASIATAKADYLLDDVRGLVAKTTVGIDSTMANLNQFSTNLSMASAKTLDIVKNNEDDLRMAVQNLKASSEHLNTVLSNVESGKGSIGKLLVDESFHQELKRLITNLRRFGILKYKDAPLPDEEKKPAAASSGSSGIRSKP